VRNRRFPSRPENALTEGEQNSISGPCHSPPGAPSAQHRQQVWVQGTDAAALSVAAHIDTDLETPGQLSNGSFPSPGDTPRTWCRQRRDTTRLIL